MSYIKRDIDDLLNLWQNENQRWPLLIRGARQVGKSYTISEFGKNNFQNFITINFEQYPKYKDCFNTLNPKEIIQSLSLLSKTEIIPGRALLFLDEIQECPRAITALRYFQEQMPELHVIGAGSLLEFTLGEKDFRMPVGRVQYIYMKPFSFMEFLTAIGETQIRNMMEHITWKSLPIPAVHQHLLSLIKKYALLGGMPRIVSEYASTGNLNRCHQIQTIIVQTYRDDFGKYASKVKHKYLQKIFEAVPKMVSNKFKYSHVDDSIQSRELKEALELLVKAGVIHRIKQTGGEGLPFEANAKERHFKTAFLDIGLMQNLSGIDSETLLSEDFIKINAGALAEQFAAQEFLAYHDPFQEASLYYWAREERSSNAEIDYLTACCGYALPVEIKAGKTGTLRSMHLFLDKFSAPLGIRISQNPFNNTFPIISIPFYGIKKIPRMIKEILNSSI